MAIVLIEKFETTRTSPEYEYTITRDYICGVNTARVLKTPKRVFEGYVRHFETPTWY